MSLIHLIAFVELTGLFPIMHLMGRSQMGVGLIQLIDLIDLMSLLGLISQDRFVGQLRLMVLLSWCTLTL